MPNFIEPLLTRMDNGELLIRIVGWLYILAAAINVLLPFYVLYNVLESRMLIFLGWGARFAFANIFLILLAAAAASALFWWGRKGRLPGFDSSTEYPVMGLFSHLLRTFGEWFGLYYACAGFLVTLIALVFMGGERVFFMQAVGMIGTGTGWLDLVFIPIAGFIILIVFRLLAELLSAFAAIARGRAA
ncbi:MAG: hypothetical protein LIO77_07085 [Rikenellaceae bacterium]|nr:hypothetical protein [Rikenellaceae bacterium]